MNTKFSIADIITYAEFYYMILHVEGTVYTVLSFYDGSVDRYNNAYFDKWYSKVA